VVDASCFSGKGVADAFVRKW